MIVGVVRRREPRIRLKIRGLHGREIEIDAVVDTGNTGWLSLPPSIVADLELRWRTTGSAELADGTISYFDVYRATVIWAGRRRRIYVDEMDATPLVGMRLLQGFELKVQVRSRGKVTIKRLPGQE